MDALLVEDDESTRLLLEEILRARGHEVASCGDAETALSTCARSSFPLILLDWLLPGMDGLELCRQIRNLPEGARSFVLMVTARDRPEDLRAVLAAGADDYVAKPIDIDAIDVRLTVAERQVENLRERHRAEDERAAAMSELARGREDLRSILNQLHVGTAMTDAAGRLTFASAAAGLMLGRPPQDLVGQGWAQALPAPAEDLDRIRSAFSRGLDERPRIGFVVDHDTAGRRWVEVEIHDDPRDPAGKIFFFYDVSELHRLRFLLGEKVQFQDLIGGSDAMTHVYRQIRQIAEVDATVLIEGETGTGKELVARAIHHASPRRDRPFVAVNCAGLTDSLLASQLFGHRRGAFTGAVSDHQGFFEQADSGTLFLDEIGDISAGVQTSLLRVLQEKEILRLGDTKPKKVDVRVLAATHHDLARDAAEGKFRSDLLYRIRVARLNLPPLRERRSDIPALVGTFVAQCRTTMRKPIEGVTEAALQALVAYSWPGNVRELKSAVEFAAIHSLTNLIERDDLPPEVRNASQAEASATPAPVPAGDDVSRIHAALQRTGGNRKEAARLLGISRATFYRRLAKLGIDIGE